MSRRRDKRIHASMQLPTDSREQPPKKLDMPVSISYRYIQPGRKYCLCRCEKQEIIEAADCLRQLTTLTWEQVWRSGGGARSGLGYTRYKDSALKRVKRPRDFSTDIEIAAIRATRKMRIYGGYKDHVFFVLWFDRNHEIVPE